MPSLCKPPERLFDTAEFTDWQQPEVSPVPVAVGAETTTYKDLCSSLISSAIYRDVIVTLSLSRTHDTSDNNYTALKCPKTLSSTLQSFAEWLCRMQTFKDFLACKASFHWTDLLLLFVLFCFCFGNLWWSLRTLYLFACQVSFSRRLRSFWLCLCNVFWTPVNSLVCWFCTGVLRLVPF